MNVHTKLLIGFALAALSVPVFGQESEEALERRMIEAEERLVRQEAAEVERVREVQEAEGRREAEEVEMRMREAERRMAEAARQVADLSVRQLPRVERIERIIRANRGPVLGITIGGSDDSGPVEGVEILGVSPGGAAEEAGLRAGDVITSVNGESLIADHSDAATEILLDFMEGVEEGDDLDVEYLRNGRNETATVSPRSMPNVFAFNFESGDFGGPDFDVHVAPKLREFRNYIPWIGHDDGFGDMELVALTERLGSYFGTDEGLLVIRAPGNDELELEDGDVILNIDGRTPQSISHAMRILNSYHAGEELEIEIMRDKRRRTIEIRMPDENQQSWAPQAPPVAPTAPRAVVAPRAMNTGDRI